MQVKWEHEYRPGPLAEEVWSVLMFAPVEALDTRGHSGDPVVLSRIERGADWNLCGDRSCGCNLDRREFPITLYSTISFLRLSGYSRFLSDSRVRRSDC